MYRCNNCNMVFNEDEIRQVSCESFYGVGGEFSYSCKNTVSVCPYCEDSDFEEITEEDLNDGEEVIY